MTDTPRFDMNRMREHVARAICTSVGRDPDMPLKDSAGREMDVPEYARWEGEADAAIRAINAFLLGANVCWDECQECAVGHEFAKLLAN